MSVAWAGLLAKIDDRYRKAKLTRLARYCTARSIEPARVDDSVVDEFGRHLADGLIPRPKQVHRNACVAWNECRGTVAGWPERRLIVPYNRRVYAMQLADFPTSFKADAEGYFVYLAGSDLFSEMPRKPASPTTLRDRRIQLLEIATALVNTGQESARIVALADLVRPAAAKAALTYL